MSASVVRGATMQCSFGSAPSTLNVSSAARVLIEGQPAAVISDAATDVNLPPFGTCWSLTNPLVASATAAADDILTPMPCVPAVVGTWIPVAPRTVIAGQPALVAGAICACAYGGLIGLLVPGTTRTTAR